MFSWSYVGFSVDTMHFMKSNTVEKKEVNEKVYAQLFKLRHIFE